jgi:CheY-like chemotaxis protein
VGDTRTILVVEDDADLRYMFRTALAFAGFSVREAGDGYEALRMIDVDPPDLVVLDLMLPTISGAVVQQEIAAQVVTRDIPVVIVTGSAMPFDEARAACVLRKPAAPSQLVDAVRQCLHSGHADRVHG